MYHKRSFSLFMIKTGRSVKILFKNVNVFDGTSDKLATGMDVLVTGNLIGKIGRDLSANKGATVIEGGGRTLMPGLIEGHGHLMMNGDTLADIENNRNWEELASRAVGSAFYNLCTHTTNMSLTLTSTPAAAQCKGLSPSKLPTSTYIQHSRGPEKRSVKGSGSL